MPSKIGRIPTSRSTKPQYLWSEAESFEIQMFGRIITSLAIAAISLVALISFSLGQTGCPSSGPSLVSGPALLSALAQNASLAFLLGLLLAIPAIGRTLVQKRCQRWESSFLSP